MAIETDIERSVSRDAELRDRCWRILHSDLHWSSVSLYGREVYSHSSCLFVTKMISKYGLQVSDSEVQAGPYTGDSSPESEPAKVEIQSNLSKAVKLLDLALIVGGRALYSHILWLVQYLEKLAALCGVSLVKNYNLTNKSLRVSGNTVLESTGRQIPIVGEISLQEFHEKYFTLKQPVIIRGALQHWPAFHEHDWGQSSFWVQNFGHRTIPVEVGNDYRSSSWKPSLMTIEDFIVDYIFPPRVRGEEIGYFAQSRVFEWIPKLRGDISVPEYLGDHDEIANIWFVSNEINVSCILKHNRVLKEQLLLFTLTDTLIC